MDSMATPDSTWLLITGISVENCLPDILPNTGALCGVFPSLHLTSRVFTSSFMNKQQQQQRYVTTCNHDVASDLSSISGSNFQTSWQGWTLNDKCPKLVPYSAGNLGGVFYCKLAKSVKMFSLRLRPCKHWVPASSLWILNWESQIAALPRQN